MLSYYHMVGMTIAPLEGSTGGLINKFCVCTYPLSGGGSVNQNLVKILGVDRHPVFLLVLPDKDGKSLHHLS